MKKITKRILGIICVLLFVAGGFPRADISWAEVAEGGIEDYYAKINQIDRIYDFAGLLSEAEETALEETIQKAVEEAQLDMVVLTVSETFGKTQRELADDFYDIGKFGYGDNSGVLLLIDMQNRQLYISTAGTAIEYVDDDAWNDILDEIAPYATDGNYEKVCKEFIEEITFYGKLGKATFFTLFRNIFIDLLIGAVVALIVVLCLRNKSGKATVAAGAVYQSDAGIHFHRKEDHFIRRSTTSRKIETQSSGGSGSTTHRSSSGTRHGGGGRSF